MCKFHARLEVVAAADAAVPRSGHCCCSAAAAALMLLLCGVSAVPKIFFPRYSSCSYTLRILLSLLVRFCCCCVVSAACCCCCSFSCCFRGAVSAVATTAAAARYRKNILGVFSLYFYCALPKCVCLAQSTEQFLFFVAYVAFSLPQCAISTCVLFSTAAALYFYLECRLTAAAAPLPSDIGEASTCIFSQLMLPLRKLLALS